MFLKVCLLILLSTFFSHSIFAQRDSLISNTDTVKKNDTMLVNISSDLQSKIRYTSFDTIDFDIAHNKVYLHRNAQIDYEDITLNADWIEIDWKTNTIYAKGLPDSSGKIVGVPVFKQNTDEVKAATILYNFESKKGKISGIVTRQGEGYILGDTVIKTKGDDYFIKSGRYTTCDAAEPHFYIKSDKLKVIKNKQVVTGPANLYIEGIPTPLAIPFGFFPNKKGRSSGLIFPKYGESNELGFFFKEGGFYFGLSDYFDLALTGDIYTLGSWAGSIATNYALKYRYSGNFDFSYSRIRVSEPELPDYSLNKSFFVNWTHRQDGKARPNSSFSASVRAGSSNFYQVNISSPTNFLQNTFNSSINYSVFSTRRPLSLALGATHSQNTITKRVDISLPSIALTLGATYPFKRKDAVDKERWYEKINFSYTSYAINSISTFDSLLFKKESLQELRNGVQHAIPIVTTIKFLKYFNLNPSFNYTQFWYFKSLEKTWNKDSATLDASTKNGFSIAQSYQAGAALSTRIYGTLMHSKGWFAGIRHIMTPSVSYTFRPDFGEYKYGIYKYVQVDSMGNTQLYSKYENSAYGSPQAGRYGFVSMSLDNNFEMKTRYYTDSSGMEFKKFRILENLGFNTGYNLALDSMQWSPLSITARTTIKQMVNLYATAIYDIYGADSLGRRIKYLHSQVSNELLRFTNSNMGLSFTINNQSFKSEEKRKADEKIKPNGYVPIAWSLTSNYNLDITVLANKRQLTQTLNFSSDIGLTPTWRINFSSGYDFINKGLTYTSVGFAKDLHCWEMRFNWVPTGFQQSYYFSINVKSSMLRDLKLEKKNDQYDR